MVNFANTVFLRLKQNWRVISVFVSCLSSVLFWAPATFAQHPNPTIVNAVFHDFFVGTQPGDGSLLFAHVEDSHGIFGFRLFWVNGDPRTQGGLELQELRTASGPEHLSPYPIPRDPATGAIDLVAADRKNKSQQVGISELHIKSTYEKMRLAANLNGLELKTFQGITVARFVRADPSFGNGWSAAKKLFGIIKDHNSVSIGLGSTGEPFQSAYNWNFQSDIINKPYFKIDRSIAYQIQAELLNFSQPMDIFGLEIDDPSFQKAFKAASGLPFAVVAIDTIVREPDLPKKFEDDRRIPRLLTYDDYNKSVVWIPGKLSKKDSKSVQFWEFENVKGEVIFKINALSLFTQLVPFGHMTPTWISLSMNGVKSRHRALKKDDQKQLPIEYSTSVQPHARPPFYSLGKKQFVAFKFVVHGDHLRYFLWGEPDLPLIVPGGITQLIQKALQPMGYGTVGNPGKTTPSSLNGDINSLGTFDPTLGSGCAISFNP